jgi:hypothetical protein
MRQKQPAPIDLDSTANHRRAMFAGLGGLATGALLCAHAHAQDISAVNKFAWGENVGFLNFADASEPVLVHTDHLEGYVWGENIGWIHLGDGDAPYLNTDDTNYGINRDPATGELSGFAWAENAGWINFQGGALADGNFARVADGRFSGFAWGENIGWINLDSPDVFVGLFCLPDYNHDSRLDFFDVSAFLSDFSADDPAADLTGDGVLDFFDLSRFIVDFGRGCDLF